MIPGNVRWSLIAILWLFIACTKEVSYEQKGNIKQGDFYATINGTLWNADSIQQVLVGSNGVGIGGLSKTGDQLTFILPELAKGTYSLNAHTESYAVFGNVFQSVSNLFVSSVGEAGGSVTITSIDSVNQLVSGSFSFNLINPSDNTTKTITQGTFDYLHYNIDPSVSFPPSPIKEDPSDTLYANIDNFQFFNSGTIEILPNNGQLTVSGLSPNQTQAISLSMPADVLPGTYDLDFTTGTYFGTYNPSLNVTFYSNNNGQLVILKNDVANRRIIGNFEFIASPISSGTPATITKGYFAVSY